MNKKLLRQWKKVFESDLGYIAYELKELVNKPAFIILNGEMGVGKTTFVKTFIQDKSVTSPTYSLIHEALDIVYADFYRLESSDEIPALELGLVLENKNFFLVEWGEKFAKQIAREIPEGFNFYMIDIFINHTIENSLIPSRDFYFYSISIE
jgi:tRNA threonylcarbamoyladenosine biosynthesis protein TsaE